MFSILPWTNLPEIRANQFVEHDFRSLGRRCRAAERRPKSCGSDHLYIDLQPTEVVTGKILGLGDASAKPMTCDFDCCKQAVRHLCSGDRLNTSMAADRGHSITRRSGYPCPWNFTAVPRAFGCVGGGCGRRGFSGGRNTRHFLGCTRNGTNVGRRCLVRNSSVKGAKSSELMEQTKQMAPESIRTWPD